MTPGYEEILDLLKSWYKGFNLFKKSRGGEQCVFDSICTSWMIGMQTVYFMRRALCMNDLRTTVNKCSDPYLWI